MLTSSKGEHFCVCFSSGVIMLEYFREYVRDSSCESNYGAAMTTIKISDELARELDLQAGLKPRSAYAAEVLWNEVRRNRQRQSLRDSAGAWKTEDHPELAEGGAAYVEKIRSEPDPRYETALKSNNR